MESGIAVTHSVPWLWAGICGAGDEMPMEANALGAVLAIQGSDEGDKACREEWHRHM